LHADLLTLVALTDDRMHQLMKDAVDLIMDTPFPVNAARSAASCIAAMANFSSFRRLFVEIGGVQALLRLAAMFNADGVVTVAAFDGLGVLCRLPPSEAFVVSGLVSQADSGLLLRKMHEIVQDGAPSLELSRLFYMRYAELGILFEEMGDFDRVLGTADTDTTPLLTKCLSASQTVMTHDGSGSVTACVRAVLRLCEVVFTQSKARVILNSRPEFFELVLQRGVLHIADLECTASALALLQAACSGLMSLLQAQKMLRGGGLIGFVTEATASFPKSAKVQYHALQILDAVADFDSVSLKILFEADPVSVALQAMDNVPGNVAILNRSILLLRKLMHKDCGRTVKDLLDLSGLQSLVSSIQRHCMTVEVACIATPLLVLVLEKLTTTSAYLNNPVAGMTKEQRLKMLSEQQEWKETVMKVCSPSVVSLCTHQNDFRVYLEPALNFLAEISKMKDLCRSIQAMNAELPLLRAIFKHSDHMIIVRSAVVILSNLCSSCNDGYRETLARCGTISVLSSVVNLHLTDSKVRGLVLRLFSCVVRFFERINLADSHSRLLGGSCLYVER
jgi:hypothetical protein